MKRAWVSFIDKDFSVSSLRDSSWERARRVRVCNYWSGEEAPEDRHFFVDLVWSERAFYVRFDTFQKEPIVVSRVPNLSSKTIGLWERDVCEIFVSPNGGRRYFEFEVAPNGEWIDLEIFFEAEERLTNWDYVSGMKVASRIENNKVLMAMKIPWEAFGKKPEAGEVWFGNLFRCVGNGKNRGYLAWSPTETPKPNFHIPEKFGEFEFVK